MSYNEFETEYDFPVSRAALEGEQMGRLYMLLSTTPRLGITSIKKTPDLEKIYKQGGGGQSHFT